MAYFFNTADDQREMLAAIGASSIDELFAGIPASVRLERPLDLPAALGELALTQHLQGLASRNCPAGQGSCFLGAGAYDHFIPAVVDVVASRSEFYTSYTPYQPEVSQGNLQAMFEYQTLICQLTGMDVSNASLYDGGSAAAEAVMLSLAVTGRHRKVVVAGTVHPEYRQVIDTYCDRLGVEVVTVAGPSGQMEVADVARAVDQQTACLLIQQPNFLGGLEEVQRLAEIAHQAGALFVVSVDPISLGLLKRPGEYGADVVIAEGQSLGSPLQYGGPYLGIMACREQFVRRLPGRLAGETVDRQGRRCWVLTLQTREQHIRRDKATSNICTNQGLFALRAAVYLACLGPQGLRETAELCQRKTAYARRRLTESSRFELPFTGPVFKEFVVRDRLGQVEQLLATAAAAGYMAGVPLGRWYPELDDCFLVAVTEKRTRAEIDGWAEVLSGGAS
ncbi:MAG: aminomethyl-transferring glycine dehydrogenase subunit GcvPA [Planctomycetota bacterium]